MPQLHDMVTYHEEQTIIHLKNETRQFQCNQLENLKQCYKHPSATDTWRQFINAMHIILKQFLNFTSINLSFLYLLLTIRVGGAYEELH